MLPPAQPFVGMPNVNLIEMPGRGGHSLLLHGDLRAESTPRNISALTGTRGQHNDADIPRTCG